MPIYSAWPTVADIADRLAETGYSLTPAASARVATTLLAVEREVLRQTQRQFVADSVASARVFDGSGTAELEIDELVELIGVAVIGGFGLTGYDLGSVQPIYEFPKPTTRLVTVRGSLPGLLESVGAASLFWVFPAGRQNVQVTAKWGYGSTIPVDLWDAVAGEVALRLLRPQVFGGGRVASGEAAGLQIVEEAYGDERRKYKQADHADLGWHEEFEAALKRYKRPQGRRLRQLRGAML